MNTTQKILVAVGIIALVLLIIFGMYISIHNGIITADNEVDRTWGNVQSAYQKRLDTIPNFVETAEFSAEFQIEIQRVVAEARSNVSNFNNDINPTELQAAAEAEYNTIYARVTAEAVPEAKTDQLTELNDAIYSTETVIKHERDAFNLAVRDFNNAIKTIPGVWFAPGMGYTEKYDMFKAEEGAEQGIDIDLDLGG